MNELDENTIFCKFNLKHIVWFKLIIKQKLYGLSRQVLKLLFHIESNQGLYDCVSHNNKKKF